MISHAGVMMSGFGRAARTRIQRRTGMIKSLAVAVVAAAVLTAAGIASAADGEAIAKSSGCLNCHAVDAKKVGPSFKDTAAKYKGKADAEATLTAKLSGAKGHPEVKAKGADLTTVLKWVLAM
jgi:cytochrome c